MSEESIPENDSVQIFYFSGTGNSLRIAELLSEKLDGEIISIPSLKDQKKVIPRSGSFGIVFPVYYADLPVIVKRFANKLEGIGDKYIFAVATYGGDTGKSLKTLSEIIKSRGGKLSGMYEVHMPQNGFKKPVENIDKIIRNANMRMDIVSEKIKSEYSGRFIGYKIKSVLLIPLYFLLGSLTKKGIAELSGSDKNMDIDELIGMADKSFTVNEKCNYCGLCERICPANNIKLEKDGPVWLHKCENCLACYNFCPQMAIETKIANKGYRYKYPGIKIDKML
ncbi:MAG: hypothetical protein PWQ77_2082 [Kosmotogales bacterium]|nr:hypothetical protein [Kosmotogales bacterium]